MLKKLTFLFCLFIFFACSKDSSPDKPTQEQTVEEETVTEEEPQEENPITIGSIQEDKKITIEVELPPNKDFNNYKIIDTQGRRANLNSSLMVTVEENTLVILKDKSNDNIVYLGYFDSSSTLSSKLGTVAKNQECTRAKKLSARSTAEWILAQTSTPYGYFTFGSAATSEIGDLLRYNVLCEVFSETAIAEAELAVIELAIDGVSIIQEASIEVIKLIVGKYTFGFGLDCIDVAFDQLESLLEDGKFSNLSFDENERQESFTDFPFGSSEVPYVLDEFTNSEQNGILIKEAMPLPNGEWKVKLKIFNSSPIPLGIYLASRANNEGNFVTSTQKPIKIVPSSSSTMIQMLKNGVTCEGLPEIIHDRVFLSGESEEIQGYKYEDIELEVTLDSTFDRIYFAGPKKSKSVKAFHVVEAVSGAFRIFLDSKKIDDKIENVDKDFEYIIYDELVELLLENNQTAGIFATDIVLTEDNWKLVSTIIKEYMLNIFSSSVDSALKDVLKEDSAIPDAADIYSLIINSIDYVQFLQSAAKPSEFEKLVKQYRIELPNNDIPTENISPVSDPNPADNAIDQPLEGSFSFTSGDNTPSDAIYRIYTGRTLPIDNFKDTTSTINDYSGLLANTKYFWRVETLNSSGELLASSDTWSFTTASAAADYGPANNPFPANGAVSMPLSTTISFSPGDNTPSDASFNLRIQTSGEEELNINLGQQTSYIYSDLKPSSEYLWQIETIDSSGNILATSPIWLFTTVGETTRTPTNGAIDQPLNGTFYFPSQTGVVIGSKFVVSYYNSIDQSEQEIETLIPEANYSNLLPNTEYFWYVKVVGPQGGTLAISDTWSFTTKGTASSGGTYQGDVVLTTQQEVDEFVINNYSGINGSLTIDGGNSINDLSGLTSLTSIALNLTFINNSNITDFGFANNITECKRIYIQDNIGLLNIESLASTRNIESIIIQDNPNLTSLKGLENGLSKIMTTIRIERNISLKSLEGLGNMPEQILSHVYLSGNAEIEKLNCFSNLKSIGGYFFITSNNKLIDINSLNSLETIGNQFAITNNPNLVNLQGLSSLTSLGFSFGLSRCDKIINLKGLENLRTIARQVGITNNDNLSSLEGLNSLETIGLHLTISGNPKLTSLEGMSKLKGIGANLGIYGNEQLTTIGLASLTGSFGGLNISDNTNLIDLNGLNGVEKLGRLIISRNQNLTNIDGLSGLESLSVTAGIYTSIQMNIDITENPKLTNLNGLNGLVQLKGKEIVVEKNTILDDFCGLTNILNSEDLRSNFQLICMENAYNPTQQDITDGNCKD